MRLVMVGLDYTTACMDIREAFSPGAEVRRDALRGIPGGEVDGCALIATCNRTELYLSHHGDVPPDGVILLCRALGLDEYQYRKYFVERAERQAVEHLMRVAGGLQSSVPGDDQIVTQVRNAIEEAREAGTADALLEALFRCAVAAGKKVKSRVSFAREGASVANEAIAAAERRLDGLADKRALVIGNGIIGRLAAAGLAERGCAVSVTLRDLRRKGEILEACVCVAYDDRHRELETCDFVVSATSSPRHTISLADARNFRRLPRLFLDLAIPRDIDPEIAGLDGVEVLNVDDLQPSGAGANAEQIARAEEIIAEEAVRFDLWRRNRRRHGRSSPGEPDFPIFVSLHGASILIAGGGKVAARRAEKLLGFGALVHVVSPALSSEMEKLLNRDGLRWTREAYRAEHMEGVTLAIAATDRREVNQALGRDARERGVLVSVADKRQECTFYFPAILKSDFLTAGLVSTNGDHRLVRRAAETLRQEMEAIDEDYQGGKPRKPAGCGAGGTGHGGDQATSS